MENIQKDIGLRLKTWRESKGIKLYKLSESIGVDTGSLSKIEKGNGGLKNEKLFVIFSKFGVNLHWLLTGEGPMLLGEEVPTSGQPPPVSALKTCAECGQPLNVAALLEEKERIVAEKDKRIALLEDMVELQKHAHGIMEPVEPAAEAAQRKVG